MSILGASLAPTEMINRQGAGLELKNLKVTGLQMQKQ